MAELPEEMITTPHELAVCCGELAASGQLGFDTEFVGEQTYHPRLCLIQVATAQRLYLIDPLSVGPLDAFWQLIIDPQRLTIVHAGKQEVRLCRMWAGQPPGRLFDLQIAAGLIGPIYPIGHGTLVSHVLDVQIAKGETLTEWRDRPLSEQQIRYAFEDVKYLLSLWENLSQRLEKLGRTTWAAEEFEDMRSEVPPETTGGERWTKLRGLGGLDRHGLAAARGLFAWREETAAAANRPSRTILRDDLIVEIARRRPARERDLQIVRGIAKRYIPAMVEVVQESRRLPLEDCPPLLGREQDPPQVQMISNILSAVLGNHCHQLELATALAANQEDLRMLVRSRLKRKPLPERCGLTRGWRQLHILPELEAVLDGRRSLRIVDLASETPFTIVDK
jgi:ribonuclease D